MLSDLDAGQFWTFGFVILKNCLGPDEVERLEEAHARVMADAPIYNYFDVNNTRMLCPFVQTDDCFAALIEQPRVMEAMCDIWGTECLYVGGSNMWVNRDDTPWHTDGRPGRHPVLLKTAIYLDEQDKDSGALNVIPGSHHPEFSATLFRACGWTGITFQGRFPSLHAREISCCGIAACGTLPSNAKTVVHGERCLFPICQTPRMTCLPSLSFERMFRRIWTRSNRLFIAKT